MNFSILKVFYMHFHDSEVQSYYHLITEMPCQKPCKILKGNKISLIFLATWISDS